MEIRSDDEQFQDLDQGPAEIKESIRGPDPRERKSIRVEIREAGNANEKNLLENQYYSISVFKDDKQITKNIKRRFSDFDMLFEILFRDYKGHILPAFPENGIMSYVKSKVALTKDDKYLKERISMVERFLTILLNEPTFYEQNNPGIKAFLSEKQFDLFKKREKEKSQGILSASWSKIMNYMKINKDSKYKKVEEQLLNEKLAFEELYKKTKCIVELLEDQKAQENWLQEQKPAIPQIEQYFEKEKAICEQQETNLSKMRKIEFDVYCENEDYVMVIKLLRNIEELKTNEQNYSTLDKAERNFLVQYEGFRGRKKESLKKMSNSFDEILREISRTDSKF